MWHKISWRLLQHELRRGELTIMAVAVALAVAAVLSLSVFSERLQQGLLERSAEFLAADRVLRSRQEVRDEWLEQAREQGLQVARRVSFNSMAFGGEELALVDVKAVTESYPLRGQLEVSDEPFTEGSPTAAVPEPGTAYVHSGVFQQLPIAVGDTLELGDAQFTISQVLTHEPDTGFNVFADSPTVMINRSDLAATGLVQEASRVSYHYLFAGEPNALADYGAWLEPQLDDLTQSWRGIQDGDSPLAASLERAEQFMLLASLLGVVLAATAVAVAANRYAQRNFDTVAVMKTLGARRGQIRRIFTLHLLMLTLFSIAVGLVLGWLLQWGVSRYVATQLAYDLPNAGWGPLVLAVSTGLLCAAMFSLYPILRLLKVPPLRVLRRELTSSAVARWLHWVISGGTVLLLMVLYSGSLLLSLALFAGGLLAMLVLLGIGRLFILASRRAGMQAGSSWRLAMAGLQRRAQQNSMQMLSFSVAVMLFLLVLALRHELLADWQRQLPDDAPNFFVVNVAPAQVEPMQEMFAAEGIPATDLYPLIPGRLTAINDTPVRDAVTKEERDDSDVREGFGRELQLTWREDLPPENRLLAGTWFTDGEPGVSVESQVAERIAVDLGDKLTFRIGADEFTVPVTNIREVDWNTMQPNFYMIFSPDLMTGLSPTYIASFHLPEARRSELYQLFRDFPEASLIDVDDILTQLRDVIGHVSLAITFVLVLVTLAGGLVLVAQVQASLAERRQELVILRTLGARERLLTRAISYEFLVLGLLAGLIATIAMEVSILILQTQVFNMAPSLHWRFWVLGPAVGAGIVTALGWSVCRQLVRQNTAGLIRGLS